MKILRLKWHVKYRIQPLQPASINSVISLPRMRLLNTLSVLADLSSEDSSLIIEVLGIAATVSIPLYL